MAHCAGVSVPPILSDLADLVLGRCCLSCGTPAPGLCGPCLARLRRPPMQLSRPQIAVPVLSAAAYSGLTRELLIAYKEHGYRSLARPLGWMLADAIWTARRLSSDRSVSIVRVPSHRRSQRGYDALGDIATVARRAISSTGTPWQEQRLLRIGTDYPALKRLGKQARRDRIAGAFRLSGGVASGAPVILVDDIITTGATIAEAMRMLTAAGIRVSAIAVVAATASPDTSATFHALAPARNPR